MVVTQAISAFGLIALLASIVKRENARKTHPNPPKYSSKVSVSEVSVSTSAKRNATSGALIVSVRSAAQVTMTANRAKSAKTPIAFDQCHPSKLFLSASV